MRVLHMSADASPREAGRAHGEAFRGEIRSLAELRIFLTVKVGGFSGEAQVLTLATEHLPPLRDYDAGLHEELLGIAEGAGVSPAHVVVLNHYTDLRDISPDSVPQAGGCSAIVTNTPGGRLLGQTWDMHATAMPYVMMMHVPAKGDRPAAWLLTLTGCLGMTGLNTAGVGVTINNLHSTDAHIGVVWSAIVRRSLHERTAAAARDAILGTRLGSGHHYLVADSASSFGIETSGELRRVIHDGTEETYVHTNHCLDAEVAARSRVPETSSTGDRLRLLSHGVAERPVEDAADLWRRLGSTEGYPRSVCTNMATGENPHGPATCGGIVMDLERRVILATAGLTHNVEPERFEFSS